MGYKKHHCIEMVKKRGSGYFLGVHQFTPMEEQGAMYFILFMKHTTTESCIRVFMSKCGVLIAITYTGVERKFKVGRGGGGGWG